LPVDRRGCLNAAWTTSDRSASPRATAGLAVAGCGPHAPPGTTGAHRPGLWRGAYSKCGCAGARQRRAGRARAGAPLL